MNSFSRSPLIISIQIAALQLMVWARVTFGHRSFHFAANPTEGGLVTSGPYHYIRHPIYTAVCLWALSALAGHWSVGIHAFSESPTRLFLPMTYAEHSVCANNYCLPALPWM